MVDPLGAMPIGPFGVGPSELGEPGQSSPSQPVQPGSSFLDILKKSVDDVNDLQSLAGNKVQKLVTGETSNLHEVMIATEEASVAFNLMMQVRNQLLTAYNELKRTPV